MTGKALQINIAPDAERLGALAARVVLDTASQGTPRNPVWIALSGGSTPKYLYHALRECTAHITGLRSSVRYFFSDERAVSPDSPDSNFLLAKGELFAPLNIPDENIVRMHGEAADLEAEAIRYATLLHVADSRTVGGSILRPLDIAILGMGSDGHTASIFPDDELAQQLYQPVFAVTTRQKISRRLTMSLDYLSRSTTALFLVSGEEKAETIRRVLQPVPGEPTLPAGMIQANQTIWFIDQGAASELDTGDKRITFHPGFGAI